MKDPKFIVFMLAVSIYANVVGGIFQRDSTVRFKVVDFDGNAISNAEAKINTQEKWIPGENFGRTVYMDVFVRTSSTARPTGVPPPA